VTRTRARWSLYLASDEMDYLYMFSIYRSRQIMVRCQVDISFTEHLSLTEVKIGAKTDTQSDHRDSGCINGNLLRTNCVDCGPQIMLHCSMFDDVK